MAFQICIVVSAVIWTISGLCSCDSNEKFIRISKNLCFAPILDGTFNMSTSWAFPGFDAANSKTTDIDGIKYFIQDASDDYIAREALQIGGVLIFSNGLQILFDTGMGEVDPVLPLGGNTNLLKSLQDVGCTDIDVVISSHLHFDHTGWNVKWSEYDTDSNGNQLIIPSWGHPTVYFVQNDEYYYWNQLREEEIREDDFANAATKKSLLLNIESLVESGQIALRFGDYYITNDVEIRRCIGHTPGHQCMYLYDDDKIMRAILSGDALHIPYQVTDADISPYFDVLQEQSPKTRKDLIQQAFDGDNVLFIPIHFPGIGQVVECNTCNSKSGFVWKKLNNKELKQWSAIVMNQDQHKTEI